MAEKRSSFEIQQNNEGFEFCNQSRHRSLDEVITCKIRKKECNYIFKICTGNPKSLYRRSREDMKNDWIKIQLTRQRLQGDNSKCNSETSKKEIINQFYQKNLRIQNIFTC